jgi:hypothetical protein
MKKKTEPASLALLWALYEEARKHRTTWDGQAAWVRERLRELNREP